jgi:MoaA/NifB/PqqE/SkfB family radical SAM enzyme
VGPNCRSDPPFAATPGDPAAFNAHNPGVAAGGLVQPVFRSTARSNCADRWGGACTPRRQAKNALHYLIDIVGTCNLRCPSCPVGNFKASDFLEKTRDKGFMDIELFRKIIDKIINESQRYGEDFSILLYNWGEAMLHPKIDEFANILQKLSIPFHMSSNLNTEAKFTQIVRAAATFRISVSGYSNETYQKGHVAGDINLVISNMYRTRYEIDRCKSAIQVSVFYHVYKDNCDEKMINLARLSRDLGFQFGIGLAYFMPLEKVLAYTEKSPSFTENDRNTMDRMDLPRFRGELGACVQSI